jgi:hypothetical protein
VMMSEVDMRKGTGDSTHLEKSRQLFDQHVFLLIESPFLDNWRKSQHSVARPIECLHIG